ncbi:MAG: Phosphoserine phosphatase RsbU [Acidobacteria bacterium ADurb.Bin340]|nr:MAG: Phosphoserine phosphatase RsbU [Acidobacteria bacterium ADurb.Bin340]HOD32550.1 PP2C family protein-serine/threonine phosphatase [Holophaga sp.]
MSDLSVSTPFERLRALALSIPGGAQELLPLVDFLETFPAQVTEEALVHLVGVTALGIAKTSQGGLWDGHKWLFLRGSATPYPTNPGEGWLSLPWAYGDEVFGHLVMRSASAPPALPLLLSISAPLLAWRRLEALRSDQNRALALQLSRLNTLFDLTRSLGEVDEKEDIVHLTANSLMAEFLISRLLVVGSDGSVLFSRGLGSLPPSLDAEDLARVIAAKGLVHALELRDQEHSHGFAYAGEPSQGRLGDEDELFLQTLVNITSTQLTSLELRESRIQSLKLEKDLDLARNIQRRILPKQLPEPPGWQCAAANLPYQAVGGDLYDLWEVPHADGGSRLHLAVGDISGKGLPASLMMTQLSAFLRAMADRRVDNWGLLATRLNARMNEIRDGNRYATLFAGSLNPANGDLRFVNGGHNPPILVPADGGPLQRLAPTGPMVGLLSGFTFGEGHAHMAPGDVLLIFTDGLVEAENLRGEDLGEETLAQIVRNRPEASADDLFEALLVETFRHMEGKGFRDDVTLVVVKRLPS